MQSLTVEMDTVQLHDVISLISLKQKHHEKLSKNSAVQYLWTLILPAMSVLEWLFATVLKQSINQSINQSVSCFGNKEQLEIIKWK